jgi:hypothetical protein
LEIRSQMNLSPPRYVPFIFNGASLALWYDSQEKQFVVLCPQCHTLIPYATPGIAYREMVLSARKCCQGCRARSSFGKSPGVVGPVLDFWCRSGNFPESGSWLEAIPQGQFSLWAK